MEFTINTAYLQEAIAKCNTIIDDKNTKVELREIHICVAENNVEFRATNGTQGWVIYNCFCVTSENVEFTLQNTKELVKAIKYFEVNIKGFATETIFGIVDNFCTITCIDKKIKLKLLNDSENKYPTPKEIDTDDMNEYNCNVSELLDVVDKVKYATAKDKIRPILMGICFDDNEIVALDGYRLVKITQNIIKVKRLLLIESSIFDIIKKVFTKNANIIIKEDFKNIFIQCGNNVVICQKMLNEFIKYGNLISINSAVVDITIDVKDTIKQLKYLYEFTDTFNHRIVMSGNKLTAKNKAVEVEANIKTTIDRETNLFEFAFNCKYMLETLQNIGSDTAIIKLVKQGQPFYVESIDGKYDILSMVLPLRMMEIK